MTMKRRRCIAEEGPTVTYTGAGLAALLASSEMREEADVERTVVIPGARSSARMPASQLPSSAPAFSIDETVDRSSLSIAPVAFTLSRPLVVETRGRVPTGAGLVFALVGLLIGVSASAGLAFARVPSTAARPLAQQAEKHELISQKRSLVVLVSPTAPTVAPHKVPANATPLRAHRSPVAAPPVAPARSQQAPSAADTASAESALRAALSETSL
jgi:hypothetical protein